MGYGDEIMVTGTARKIQEFDFRQRPVAVYGHNRLRRWSTLWEGNPRILPPSTMFKTSEHLRLFNGPRCRPYVDYNAMAKQFDRVFPGQKFTTKIRHPELPWRYTNWRASPGELPWVELMEPRGYIVIEPNPKPNGNPNKDWGWNRWQALVSTVKWIAHPWVQLGPKRTPILEGVTHIVTPTFADACSVLSGASALVSTEGGLHHAAAALDIPGVVIWGGISSPANLGYDLHSNLFERMDGESPCGQWVRCDHCREAMARISTDRVLEHLNELLT